MTRPLATTPLDQLSVDTPGRPSAPRIPEANDSHRRAGRHLAAIHRHHLQDMARITKVIDRIAAGDSPPQELADIVLASDMAQNFRAFGTLCGQECRMLTFHHDAEEHQMFPELESRGTDGLRAVVQRLRDEHEVVHELLVRLASAAQGLHYDPTETRFDEVRAIFAKLHEVVRSHFRYEETELEEAIGVHLTHI